MLAAIKHYFIVRNIKNDLLPACDFKISLAINCESTWPGLMKETGKIGNICNANAFYQKKEESGDSGENKTF